MERAVGAGYNTEMTNGCWAASPLHDVNHLSQTLLTLENSAPVALIATFNVATCNINDAAEAVLATSALKDFDYIPVVSAESIVGVVSRNEVENPKGPVRETMQSLHESILISADASLLSFVAEVDTSPVRLVLEGSKITGIVTISDIQKLATRPLLFMLITSVELLLAEWIRQKLPDETVWLGKLSEGRRSKIKAKWEKLQENNLAINHITTTDFCDKRDIFLRFGTFAEGKKSETKNQLKAIEQLRDSIAHAGDYALTPDNAKKVAETVRGAKEIITTLQAELEFSPAVQSFNLDSK